MPETGALRGLDARLQEMPPAAWHDLLLRIAAIDEYRGWWRGRNGLATTPHARVDRRVVDVSARAATLIDTAPRLVAPESSPHRSTKPPAAHEPRVAGYAELLRAVFEGYRTMTFGQPLILEFHARLLKHVPEDRPHRGRYKQTAAHNDRSALARRPESIALRPTDPDLIQRAMTLATDWTVNRLAASEFHPLLIIPAFVLEFLAIRPFVDGNGRLSRILTILLLLQQGYAFVASASLDRVIADRWTDYYFALRRSQVQRNLPNPDISQWLRTFLDTLRLQIREVRDLVDARAPDRRLSERQVRVLELVERHTTVTNRFLCTKLGMPRDTAKQVLGRLVTLGLVQRVGAGRAVRYRRAPRTQR